MRSILLFAKWQIGIRVLPGPIIHSWINDCRFVVGKGETGFTGNLYTGLHEFADMGFLLHFLRPEDVFVDIGANVGAYTVLASGVVGATGVAFEPIPGTFARLVDNIRINNFEGRVSCINRGVGSTQCSIQFTSNSDTTNHALAKGEESPDSIVVEVAPLDAQLAGKIPSLIKIDVEGFESQVLEGATATLKSPLVRAVIIELNGSGSRYGVDERDILRVMSNFGFESYSYDPFSRRLKHLNGKSCEHGNTLFIRDHSFVAERLRSAATIRVFGHEF